MPHIAKIVAAALILCTGCAESLLQASSTDKPRLYGLKKIAVKVSTDPDADLDQRGLQTAIEAKLRSAGIKVDKGSRSHLTVVISVSLIRSAGGENLGFAYSVHLSLIQQVYLAHNPQQLTEAATWQTMSLGTSAENELEGRCRRVIGREMDEFVAVYLSGTEK